jgi:hydrogenase nickel incorporation protein HypB
MCSSCGCGHDAARVTTLGQPEGHTHEGHTHEHVPADPGTRTHTLELEVAVLAKNDELAAANRDRLAGLDIVAVNLMSSPARARPLCWSARSPTRRAR